MDDVINKVVINNTLKFTSLKAAEECSELAAVLLQSVNKKKVYPIKDIIEEIGDVELRLKILKRQLNIERAVKFRENSKLSKLNGYLSQGKYKGGM